jgi:hypothetical protein
MAGESLKVVAGNATGSSIELENELVIGRSTPGLGSLGGDSEISRVHARVFHDPSGQLTVEDLGSTNGTFVNGNRVSGQQALRSGDQLRVGQTTMTVEGGAADGATTVGNVIPAPIPSAPPAAAQPPTQQLPPTQPLPPSQPPPPAYAPQPPAPGYAGGPIGGPPQAAGGGSKAPWYALAAVVLIALIVGGLAIGGVFGGDDKKDTASKSADTTPATTPTTPTTPTETTPSAPPADAMPEPPPTEPSAPSGGYPPGFIKNLVDQCAQNGKLTRSQCQCAFGRLKNAYTFPELIDVLKQASKGSIPPKARAIIQQCASS